MRAWAAPGLACLLGLLGAAPLPDPVHYRLHPVLEAGRLTRLAVEVRFRGDEDGVTEVRLPNRFNGETDLHRHLTEFSVTGATLARPGPSLLRLTHRRGARLTLRYRVRNGRGTAASVDYRPDLDPDGFTVLGETVFAWPAGRLSGPASLGFGPFPGGWRWASDLPRATTVGAVLESATTAGRDVEIQTRGQGDAGVSAGFRGRFAFTATEFADRLHAVLRAQAAMLGEPAKPFTAVVQGLPDDPRRFTRDGVGRGDGAAYFISGEEPLHLLNRILAHEAVHAWLPRKVGGLPRGPAEPGGYWFSEGFADFVGLRSLVRADVWTLGAYVSDLDGRLSEVVRPGPAVPNAAIVADPGRPDLRELPYRRGLALAVLWDSRLREATDGRRGIDDVLGAMRARAAARPDGPTADRLFPVVYRELGGPDLSADLDAYVRDGRPIVWPAETYDGCLVRPQRVSGSSKPPAFRLALAGNGASERCRRLMVGG